MRVPAFMVDGDETHASLHHASGEEAGPRERGFLGLASVERECFGRFALEVHEFGRRALETKRHFIICDARGDFWITLDLEAVLVECAYQIQRLALLDVIDAFRGGDIQDGIALIAEASAGVKAGHEAAGPARGAATNSRSRAHDNEGGKIPGFRSEAVGGPRTDAGTARLGEAGVHKNLCWSVVELVGFTGTHQGDVIHNAACMRQHFGEFHAGLAVFSKRELRTKNCGIGADKCITLAADHGRGERFSFEFCEFRFWVEKLQLRGGAGHEQLNDGLGFSRVMGGFWTEAALFGICG